MIRYLIIAPLFDLVGNWNVVFCTNEKRKTLEFKGQLMVLDISGSENSESNLARENKMWGYYCSFFAEFGGITTYCLNILLICGKEIGVKNLECQGAYLEHENVRYTFLFSRCRAISL